MFKTFCFQLFGIIQKIPIKKWYNTNIANKNIKKALKFLEGSIISILLPIS